MKIYLKIIKKFYLPLLALAILGIIFFGILGVNFFFQDEETKAGIKESEISDLKIAQVEDKEKSNESPEEGKEEKTSTQEKVVTPEPQVKNIPSTRKNKVDLDQNVFTKINAGSAAGNYMVDYKRDENACELLLRIAKMHNFSVNMKDYGWGIYVKGIGGLDDDGKDFFWFFYTNGIISEVGCADYLVQPNDITGWRYHEWWVY